MNYNFKPVIRKILSISLLCQITFLSFSQNTSIQEITIPKEIKSINSLLINDKSTVWLATGQGLFSYGNNEFTRYFDEKQADLYCINSIINDNSGNKWYGTYNGQLVKFGDGRILKAIDLKTFCKTENYLITSLSINQGDKNENNDILLTTAGGEILSYDTITGIVQNIKSPSQGTIYAIQYGYSSAIWLCTSDGFYTTQKNSKWKKKADLYTAYGIYQNRDGYWAIGRDENKEAILMLYYNENLEGGKSRYLWKKFDLVNLNNKYVRFYKLGFTSDEMVWITCDDGLIRYNPLNANISEFRIDKKLEQNPVQNIAVQNDELIWISTSGKKLFRVDLK